MKTDLKMIGLVAAGVFAAGFIMNALRDNDFIKSAIGGFDA